MVGLVLCWSVAAAEPEAPVEAPSPEPPTADGPSEDIVTTRSTEIKAKHRESPEFPAEARLTGTEGECKVRIIIDTSGRPERVEVIACDPYFIGASVDAALKSSFPPVLVDGEPVKAAFLDSYKFRLGDAAESPPPPPPVLDTPIVIEALPPIPKGRFREVEFTDLTCDQVAQVTFPERARAAGVESSCRVMLYFNAQGEVIHTEPLSCREPFITAVRRPTQPFVCAPVERRGEAIPVKAEYTFQFKLR